MSSDLVSLADASALLGVSSERVRQLVMAGDIPGVRFGNAWAVPREAILAREHGSSRRGRPLSARNSWEMITAGQVDLSNTSRFRNRGELHRLEMSHADLQFLTQHDNVLVSGIEAAIGFGELLSADAADLHLYLPDSLYAELISMVAAIPDPLGSVRLRVVPDEVWGLVIDESEEKGAIWFAPRSAVALDLMESADPRHWIAAENLVARRG